MGPVDLMKSTRKQKLFAIIGFLLEFFPNSFSPLDVSKKVSVGGGVVCLNIVSTPGPVFFKVKTRFGQVGD